MPPLRSLVLVAFLASATIASAANPGPPLRVLLIAGGCCHDYATQTQLLKKGIEARVRAQVDVVYNPDTSAKATFDLYGNPDWDKGYDVVIHDECSADVTDRAYVERILAAHRRGTPAVNLHCAMHSYRWSDFKKAVPAGADNAGWFESLLWAAGRLGDDGAIAADLVLASGEKAAAADWAGSVALPAEERSRAVRLFNGRDFEGWEGHIDPYWSIENGEIVGRNGTENAPPVSTYLLTEKPYRTFRLLFEGKLVTSEMHSGVAIWGKKFEKDGEMSSYQGHLVMFPSGWGLYDLYRRNGISGDQEGRAKKAGRQHDWNQMEILAIGSRIRLAVNGQEVLDWSDPKPELCQPGPLGLQLHSNKVPQEVRFRGLVLVEDPQDMLVTAAPAAAEVK